MRNYSSLSFQQLRKECAKNGLSGGGSAQVLRKRLQGAIIAKSKEEEEARNKTNDSSEHRCKKRQKRSIEDDLICPITLELPIDPVTAEDGRVYERDAIQMHFDSCRKTVVKSPMTNVLMGQRLFPAPQAKSIIETSIHNGTISRELANKWKAGMKEKACKDALLSKAEKGHVPSMETVGSHYINGRHGFRKDPRQAYSWFDRACRAGSVWGTAQKGHMMAMGFGTAKNQAKGVLYVASAESKGSDWAAYCLGMDLYKLQFTKEEAIYYLQRCLGVCPYQNLPSDCKMKARGKLDKLFREEQERAS